MPCRAPRRGGHGFRHGPGLRIIFSISPVQLRIPYHIGYELFPVLPRQRQNHGNRELVVSNIRELYMRLSAATVVLVKYMQIVICFAHGGLVRYGLRYDGSVQCGVRHGWAAALATRPRVPRDVECVGDAHIRSVVVGRSLAADPFLTSYSTVLSFSQY